MVSKNNQQYKRQQEARRVPHYGIRKLSIGVASVLLGTVFYMQNGTAHADVNPMVNAGNDSVNVVNKDSGASGSTGASSTSTGASSASSVVLTGNTTNSTTPRQASGSPVDGATKQVNNVAWGVSEPGVVTPAGQGNTGANKTNVGSSLSPVSNRQTNAAGNSSDNQLSANLSLSVNQKLNANLSSLLASKMALTGSNAVNGGFDEATWGTLDVSKWTGQENNGVYELTGYTGDLEHIIVPNSADFAKAGRNVGQVGISADTTHSWFLKGSPKSIAFSKTDGQMVKAVGSDWTGAFTGAFDRSGEHIPIESVLTLFDGSNLDVLNITNMLNMFTFNQISDLTSLANWKTDNVTDMHGMFGNNQISDLAPLANWETDNVRDMGATFMMNQISDLSPLVNWKTNNVTDMSYMFNGNQIAYADFTKWNFGKVNSLDYFIYQWTPAIIIAKNVDKTLLANSQAISTEQNQLHFGADAVDMPTVYVASDKADVRQKILADINTKLANYEVNHTDKMVTPTVPLDQLTKLVDLANAKFMVKHTLPELDTNDAFALDSKNGLHEHANVNDNGGYDTDFWGALDVSKFTTVKNGDDLEITGYTGDASKVIIPNIADFEIDNLDQGAKQVTISSQVMRQLAKNATRIGLSKTNNQKVVASDAIWQDAFGGLTVSPRIGVNGGMWVYNPNLAAMDLHNLDTTNITDMSAMFNGGRNLNVVGDLSQWNVFKVTDMSNMFRNASSLTNIGDLSKWNVSKVTNMSWMFYDASSLTNVGDLDNWNTSKVTDMSFMFSQASDLTNIGDLSKWDVSKVTDMSYMFYFATALKQLNISNWDLTKLANKDSMKYMFANDTDLTVIANDLKLPVWYQNEINDADYFWNNHMAVITNVPELIRSTGDIDNLKIDDQDASRSIFYDSKGSSDAIQVLKDANQAYIKQYQNEHPGYTLNLAADVDQTDPIALANANFVSAPREVQFTIAYYDLTGKLVNSTTSTHKVGDTVSISLVAPVNYVLVSGQSNTNRLMHWGLNEADFLVEPKVTTTTHTKTVSRTIKVQTPDGQMNNVVQTVTFTRNGYLNQITKQTTYSPWSFNGQYQFSGYQPKPVDGYTADVVPAVSVTPDSLDTTVNVAYHQISAVYSVAYQLANGTVVKNVSVTPERDGMIHLAAPQGYRLLTSVTDVQVVRGSQKLTVLVAPAEQTYTVHDDLPSGVTEPLIKTVTRTVKITMPNGHIRTVKQSVKFERTATVKADGTVSYGDWQAIGRAQFNKVFVPKRRGYHLVITDASGKALTAVEKINMVTAEMNDTVVNVKYVKD